jgi:choline-sulfatase
MYDPASVDVPYLPPDNLANGPPRLANWRRHWGLEDLTEAQIRRARAAYFAMISFVDDQMGTVLGELRALGLEDDTFVVYLADHGEMAGEHGLWYKSVFFDGAAKVPFILSYPKLLPPGRQIDTPVELVDLFPTLAGLIGAGGQLPEGLDGADLLPHAAGGAPAPKDAAFSEHYTQGVPTPQRMIRTQRWKYNYYAGEPGELYDLQEDPGELRNLARDSGYRDVVRDLEARVLAGWNLEPARAEVDGLMARQRQSNTGFSYSGRNRSASSG